MADSAKGKTPKNATAGGPTGPRTPQGKGRSSQNSGTHLIFSKRVPEGQGMEAASLRKKLQEQFQSGGALDGEMLDDMVINRMQKRRIDGYAAREIDKARGLIAKERYEKDELRQSQAWLRIASTGDEVLETWRHRLPPNHCITFLKTLREMNEKRDLGPGEGIKLLRFVYKGQFTPLAAVLMSEFSSMKSDQSACQGDEKKLKQIDQEYRARITGIIDKEIEYQQWLSETEAQWDEIEFPLDDRIFPADPILDRAERYRTANAREFSRLLENMETVRRLCPEK